MNSVAAIACLKVRCVNYERKRCIVACGIGPHVTGIMAEGGFGEFETGEIWTHPDITQSGPQEGATFMTQRPYRWRHYHFL